MNAKSIAQKITFDPRVTAIARVSMIIMPLITGVIMLWLNIQKDTIEDIQSEASAIADDVDHTRNRITVIETLQLRGKDFENETKETLEMLRQQNVAILQSQAGIIATLNSMQDTRVGALKGIN